MGPSPLLKLAQNELMQPADWTSCPKTGRVIRHTTIKSVSSLGYSQGKVQFKDIDMHKLTASNEA